MSVIKKTTLMFSGALLLFFLLSFIDEYENLFLGKRDEKRVIADPYEIELTLKRYVKDISSAYLDPGQPPPSDIPISEELYKELADEVEFLRNDGRIQKLDIKDLWVQDVNQVAYDKVRVTTRELVSVNYFNISDMSEIRSIPPAMFDMSYVLEYRDKSWVVIRYDEMGIAEIKRAGT